MAKKGRDIELKVSWHPIGRWTLMQRVRGEALYKDRKGVFMANADPARFYRAVAKKIARMAARGDRITYKDTAARLGSRDGEGRFVIPRSRMTGPD
jgi:hypothetical protein